MQPFGHNRRGRKLEGLRPFLGRGLGPHLTQYKNYSSSTSCSKTSIEVRMHELSVLMVRDDWKAATRVYAAGNTSNAGGFTTEWIHVQILTANFRATDRGDGRTVYSVQTASYEPITINDVACLTFKLPHNTTGFFQSQQHLEANRWLPTFQSHFLSKNYQHRFTYVNVIARQSGDIFWDPVYL